MLAFGAAVSAASDHQRALDEAIPAAMAQLGAAPDLVVCFFSMEHAEAAAGIALSLSERTGSSAILACTAQGMVSGARELGRHRLVAGTEVVDGGAVGVALVGPVEVRAVVSQGCRPVGTPFAVTSGEGNVVHELGGRPAVD